MKEFVNATSDSQQCAKKASQICFKDDIECYFTRCEDKFNNQFEYILTGQINAKNDMMESYATNLFGPLDILSWLGSQFAEDRKSVV